MERYTMWMEESILSNDYTTQDNLQIQCNPYQITKGIFHRNGIKNFKICIKTQKTPKGQSNPETEKWNWQIRFPDFRL